MTCRVVIADDHPLLLQALSELVESSGSFDVIEASSNGHCALARIRADQPDIAILDLDMPVIGGMDILRAVHENNWTVRVIFLSASMTSTEIANAIKLGVWGLVLKDYATEELLNCLQEVATGNRWLPEQLIAKSSEAEYAEASLSLSMLTPRETAIAELVAQGYSNRGIAEKLGGAEGTVSIHLHNIYRKLDIGSRAKLAALLVRGQN